MRETFDGIVKSCQDVSMHSWATLDITHPTTFDALAVNCIREATKSYPEEVLISGAGHDS